MVCLQQAHFSMDMCPDIWECAYPFFMVQWVTEAILEWLNSQNLKENSSHSLEKNRKSEIFQGAEYYQKHKGNIKHTLCHFRGIYSSDTLNLLYHLVDLSSRMSGTKCLILDQRNYFQNLNACWSIKSPTQSSLKTQRNFYNQVSQYIFHDECKTWFRFLVFLDARAVHFGGINHMG